MFNKSIIALLSLFVIFASSSAYGQHTTNYNLAKLLKANKLDTSNAHQTVVSDTAKKGAITTNGFVWLTGVNFKEGTIDVDLRGKDVFLKSFLGIAFHAKDTANYELVFFRPFRFHSADTATRNWSVQYVSSPGYDYDVLRKAHPGVYEHKATPAPVANEWFHATIVVKDSWITVYINHSATASMQVKKLNSLEEGRIALWDYSPGVSGDFANLSVTQ